MAVKTEQEITNARGNVYENEDSTYHGMSYEQGIADALDWAVGNLDEEDFGYSTDL